MGAIMKFNILTLAIILSMFIGCGGEVIKVTVETPTIQCGMCQKMIEKGLAKLQGVSNSKVDLATKTTIVSYEADKTDLTSIQKTISKLGYEANGMAANKEAYESLPACCKIGGMDK
tara:strand:- start:562 stop:912 length:351 start_codon:yes stop_codon:yes gene_type:complete